MVSNAGQYESEVFHEKDLLSKNGDKKTPEDKIFRQNGIRRQYGGDIFFHPDYTVGTGIAPVPALRLADYTADREFHPALKMD